MPANTSGLRPTRLLDTNSKFALLGKVAFVAIATLFTSDAFGATSTWKNGTTSTTRVWATSTNWSPGAPASGATALFTGGTSQTYGVTLNSDTSTVAVLQFTAANGSYAFSGTGSLQVNGTITNNLNRLTGIIGLAQGATGLGSVILSNLTLAGDTALSGSGAGTELRASTISGPGNLTVTNSTLIINNGSSFNTGLTTSGSSTIKFAGSSTFADLTNGASATLQGNGAAGIANVFDASGTVLVLDTGSTTNERVGYVDAASTFNDKFTTSGATTFGGTLNVDWSQVGSGLFDNNTAIQLFSADSFSGNFSGVNLVGATGPYAGLTFTQSGSDWVTGLFVGQGGLNQSLSFQSTSGQLLVVPEPDTIALLALGAGGILFLMRRRIPATTCPGCRS